MRIKFKYYNMNRNGIENLFKKILGNKLAWTNSFPLKSVSERSRVLDTVETKSDWLECTQKVQVHQICSYGTASTEALHGWMRSWPGRSQIY